MDSEWSFERGEKPTSDLMKDNVCCSHTYVFSHFFGVVCIAQSSIGGYALLMGWLTSWGGGSGLVYTNSLHFLLFVLG